ncbi:hypothetical protein Ccrd_020872 [Cynara cardunculus var. scolymus]|uniref:non-specific serine/threonine protein kinase n=1 Tax=Cynara cardunculus var. scolymus TaxID=59895 RepID=A0A118K0J6_CYNCS|nr:hypothetical protein Ccrd_020872 [Cynara cardunculus var. scolymus]
MTTEGEINLVKASSHIGMGLRMAVSVGIPRRIIRCLEHVELKDAARPVAFLAKMTVHQSLLVQLVGKGLLDPNMMRRLLDSSSPREVILDILMIISDLARMDKIFKPSRMHRGYKRIPQNHKDN